jgi:hypothetical protein
MNTAKRGPLHDHLDSIEALCKTKDPTLKDIFQIFGPDGHFVLILFMILPFMQPIPLMGLSTVFGVLIGIVTIFYYFNRPPWLPRKWINKTLSANTVLKIVTGSEKIFDKVTFFSHPRWPYLFKDPFRTLNCLLLIINAVLLALPLPIPLSNAFPAWMIFFQALAYLEEDGLFILLSYVQSILCFTYFALITFGVSLGLEKILAH